MCYPDGSTRSSAGVPPPVPDRHYSLARPVGETGGQTYGAGAPQAYQRLLDQQV